MSAFGNLIQKCGDILVGYGLPGVVIIILLYACRNLFAKYCEVQEKRIAEAQAQTTALQANTFALTRMADAMRGVASK